MHGKSYAGPSDTNDFDGLRPDEMAKAMHEYQLLGECFEAVTDEDTMGKGWVIDSQLILVEGYGKIYVAHSASQPPLSPWHATRATAGVPLPTLWACLSMT